MYNLWKCVHLSVLKCVLLLTVACWLSFLCSAKDVRGVCQKKEKGKEEIELKKLGFITLCSAKEYKREIEAEAERKETDRM